MVCLPILTQPEVIKKALSAGKHVLSEKPVAKDVATAKELIAWHAALPNAPLWAVGENFRYMSSLEFAASKVKELGGKVVAFHLHMYNLIPDDDKYLNTPCMFTSDGPFSTLPSPFPPPPIYHCWCTPSFF